MFGQELEVAGPIFNQYHHNHDSPSLISPPHVCSDRVDSSNIDGNHQFKNNSAMTSKSNGLSDSFLGLYTVSASNGCKAKVTLPSLVASQRQTSQDQIPNRHESLETLVSTRDLGNCIVPRSSLSSNETNPLCLSADFDLTPTCTPSTRAGSIGMSTPLTEDPPSVSCKTLQITREPFMTNTSGQSINGHINTTENMASSQILTGIPEIYTQIEKMQDEVRYNSIPFELDSTTSIPNSSLIQRPSVPVKLFVNRVPKWMLGSELRRIFTPFGHVLECNILKDSNGSKGCAFVKFSSIVDAHHAIINLHSKKVLNPEAGPVQIRYADGEIDRLGLSIDVQPGGESVKLFVGCLPKSCTEVDLYSVFSRFGQVDEAFVLRDSQQKSKYSAFITYPKMEMAVSAIIALDRKVVLPVSLRKGGRRPLEVRLAESKYTRCRTNTKTQQHLQHSPTIKKEKSLNQLQNFPDVSNHLFGVDLAKPFAKFPDVSANLDQISHFVDQTWNDPQSVLKKEVSEVVFPSKSISKDVFFDRLPSPPLASLPLEWNDSTPQNPYIDFPSFRHHLISSDASLNNTIGTSSIHCEPFTGDEWGSLLTRKRLSAVGQFDAL